MSTQTDEEMDMDADKDFHGLTPKIFDKLMSNCEYLFFWTG